MSIDNPILFYAIAAILAFLFITLVLVVILLVRRLRRMKMHLYDDELELSAKIEF